MGTVLNKTAYEWETSVTSFQADMYNRLKISSLMQLHQEIGEKHLNEFGTRSDTLRKEQNLAFIFTKIAIKIHSLPKCDEEIRLRTWCSGLKGVRFTRNYLSFSKDGTLLTEAKGEVTTLNLIDRKIVRPKEIKGFDDFLYNEDLENGCNYPEKIRVGEQYDHSTTRTVRYSDTDYNGHLNNTVYSDIMLDCLDFKALEKTPTGITVCFVNEALPGETLTVDYSVCGNEALFHGHKDGKTCFTGKIEL